MKRLIIILFISLNFTSFILATENDQDLLPHYIGGAAGFSTGYGLSYRYWEGEYGTQVVFTPLFDGTDILLNLGSGIFKSLHDTQYTKLFLYLAANATYTKTESYNYSDVEPYSVVSSTSEHEFDFAIGIGPGLEVYLFKNIVIDLMFGYKYSTGGITTGVGFSVEGGIYYRF